MCPGDVDVKKADGLALDALPRQHVPVDVGQPRDAMALEAVMQCRARQVRDGGLRRIETVVQGQQCVAPERDDQRLFRLAQPGRPGCFRTRLQILNRCPLPPLHHRLRVDAKVAAQLRNRTFRSLESRSDRVHCRGPSMTNPRHWASSIAPKGSHHQTLGTKHIMLDLCSPCFYSLGRHIEGGSSHGGSEVGSFVY